MSRSPAWFCLARQIPWLGLQLEGLHSFKTGMIEQDGDGRSATQMIEQQQNWLRAPKFGTRGSEVQILSPRPIFFGPARRHG